jgi:hypothetical protein
MIDLARGTRMVRHGRMRRTMSGPVMTTLGQSGLSPIRRIPVPVAPPTVLRSV